MERERKENKRKEESKWKEGPREDSNIKYCISPSKLVITTNSGVVVTHLEWEHTLSVGS